MRNKISNNLLTTIVAMVLFGVVPATQAEVLDADAHGFSIRIKTLVKAQRMAVYTAAIDSVGSWWDSDHTISGFAQNLYIDVHVPGCFCENLGKGAGIVHMAVTYVSPGNVLRLTGGLGPLGLMGVAGNMTWEFDDAEDGTVVTLNYVVGGYHADGLDTIASAVDVVLEEAMMRLRAFAETGDPEGQS